MSILFGTIKCAGRGKEAPADLMIDGAPSLQQPALFRRASGASFDRKNVRGTFGFRTEREHDDVEACQRFIDRHRNAVLAAGRQTLKHISAGSQSVYENAVVSRCDGKQVGVRSIFTYQFSIGLSSTVT
jgi:hypothetical protein